MVVSRGKLSVANLKRLKSPVGYAPAAESPTCLPSTARRLEAYSVTKRKPQATDQAAQGQGTGKSTRQTRRKTLRQGYNLGSEDNLGCKCMYWAFSVPLILLHVGVQASFSLSCIWLQTARFGAILLSCQGARCSLVAITDLAPLPSVHMRGLKASSASGCPLGAMMEEPGPGWPWRIIWSDG